MSIIDDFANRYLDQYDYYKEVSRVCAEQCEAVLERDGIRSIVTYRAKRPDRLRAKIEQRNAKLPYDSLEAIEKDLVDLAGVRIALYFPGDREEVRKLIASQFIILEPPGEFPSESTPKYEKRFSGYWATHYHVCMREEALSAKWKSCALARIEIQVASVLMHAWAEVEHELAYKRSSGPLSREEYAILDELNGLVLTGEIALEQLQQAVKARIAARDKAFRNHYELAIYLYDRLYDRIRPEGGQAAGEPLMGRVDILLKFLQLAGLDKPMSLENLMNETAFSETRPLAEQLADRLLAGDPSRYWLYAEARRLTADQNPYWSTEEERSYRLEEKALIYFLSRWTALELAVRETARAAQPDLRWITLIPSAIALKQLGLFDPDVREQVESLRRLRNRIIHGTTVPESDVLFEAGRFIEDLLGKLREGADEKTRKILDIALAKVSPGPEKTQP